MIHLRVVSPSDVTGTLMPVLRSEPAVLNLTMLPVMAWLLNLTPQKIVQAAPAALTEYGQLLETFAVGEILKQASWSDAPVTAGHFRTEADDEVDLVLERDDGQIMTQRPNATDSPHSRFTSATP
jgi:hypothetical protein